jgi:PIN domain nuclease of toxin-antitoxin system
MIHIDTHVAIWIHDRQFRSISKKAQNLLERETVMLSPMALFEYEILVEKQRFSSPGDTLVADLEDRLGLTLSQAPFASVVAHARTFAWTHDPFDRLIVANAMADGARLLTADAMILDNFKDAVW